MPDNLIKIRGARVNNLKNIDIDLPRHKLIVVTGLSGSGKSSLAFDTIYAEGQRRYVESLSSYARQFVNLLDKPELDLIEGLSPAIAIDQRTVGHNPRSTVGTITEIYDYLRLLFAKIGIPYCPNCQIKLKKIKDLKPSTNRNGKITGNKRSEWSYACEQCSHQLLNLKPKDFSFNSNYGACPDCLGLGVKLEIDPNLVLNTNLSIAEGAIKPWRHFNLANQTSFLSDLRVKLESRQLDLNRPIKNFSKTELDFLLFGDDDFFGLIKMLKQRYQETKSGFIKSEIEKCMRETSCPTCHGQRLKPAVLAVKIDGLSIYDLADKNVSQLKSFLSTLIAGAKNLNGQAEIVAPIIGEMIKNLEFLEKVGLDYLSLTRSAASLSGGEAQRIRLASQVGSTLSGVLYVLDEPSIGLHQRDNDKLIAMLKNLRDNDNTVIVVEHDAAMMLAADHLVDIGPGAGQMGGHIIYSGQPAGIKDCPESLTGKYLSGIKQIPARDNFRPGKKQSLKIIGASEHNLKNIDVEIPLGKLVAITGVSGSGKSTLMTDILANVLKQKFYRAKALPGKHRSIEGLDNIDKVIDIDQSPIGRTPRSNPATYTGAFTYIRDLFAVLPESKLKGYGAGHFSFNVAGGRCENCAGDGVIKVDMQFLSDIYLTCDVCGGKKFKPEILEINYKGKNIYDVLEMTVSEALPFFKEISALYQKLLTLDSVGLGYIKLGQSATTFSGGEAQRIKLATELSRRATGKTLCILDEPTTGLHFADIERLLKVLNMLVDQGNTVLIIEHNLDVIKAVDWIIDLGPEGGDKGGYIAAEGSPQQVAQAKNSYTAKYLKEILGK
ncbi:MAG: excinuclease ABC subunit UvrA [Patescibacteria group bacterium]